MHYLGYVWLILVVAWLIRQAFFQKAGSFLSWPMYNCVAFTRVALYDEATGAPVTPWRDMIHIDYGGGIPTLREYLDYIDEVRGLTVSGEGVVADTDGYHAIRVTRNHVDLA